MKKKYLTDFLKYQNLLKDFNSIYRDSGSLHHTTEPDNDVEHSFRVAMLCWMMIEKFKLKLDIDKVLKYALLHDFVEIYAGDLSLWGNHTQEEKRKKEHKSFLKLKKDFPEFKNFWKIINTYEKKQDEESKFVHVIEKLEPALLVIISDKEHFKKRKIALDFFLERKGKKIYTVKSFATVIYEEVADYFKKHPEFFK